MYFVDIKNVELAIKLYDLPISILYNFICLTLILLFLFTKKKISYI